MKFRTLNRWYAYVAGYFWLPCPLCGQHFGGHEWRVDRHGHECGIPRPEQPGGAWAICRDCTSTGRGCAAYAERDGYSPHGCAAASDDEPDTVVLDVDQVAKLRDDLTWWLDRVKREPRQ